MAHYAPDMPRRPSRTAPTVIIPGLDGATADHWQSWLADELRAGGRDVRFPELPAVHAPRLDPWLRALHSTLDGLADGGFDLVAHSLGAILWLHHTLTADAHPKPARVVLVAIPAPDVLVPNCEEFFPPPLDVDAVRKAANGTALVGSDNDPFCPAGVARSYGAPLKIATTVIPGGAHLNVAAGLGPWPAMLDWCNRDNLAFIG